MNKTRPLQIRFRVNQTEKELILNACKSSGTTLQDYLYSVVVTPLLNPKSEEKKQTCPWCGGQLVKRTRKKDNRPFLGCSNFPSCHFVKDLLGDNHG